MHIRKSIHFLEIFQSFSIFSIWRTTYQRSRRCSEARKCATAHLPKTQCNVPEPILKLASPVTERKNKFSSSRKFFWSKGAGLACTPFNRNQLPSQNQPARGENPCISSAGIRCGSRYCYAFVTAILQHG